VKQWRAAAVTAVLAVLSAIALIIAASAGAFGTIEGAGQAAEHEDITRASLWCAATSHVRDCFEDWSVAQLAGQKGALGAVGAPDVDQPLIAAAHCDNSDYLDVPDYPQKPAKRTAALVACADYARQHFFHAVMLARNLLTKSGKLDPAQVEPGSCSPVGNLRGSGPAKCGVLNQFGRALHTAQDFYSHTNWADVADPARPEGIDNPPGLAMPGLSPLFNYLPVLGAIPKDLTGGCFAVPPGCLDRVKHGTINKDEGTINPVTGAASAPKTTRGMVAANFASAVGHAIGETKHQWDLLTRVLVIMYGKRKGDLMICALTHDHPTQDCQLKVTLTGKQVISWTVNESTSPGTTTCAFHKTGKGQTTIDFATTKPVYASPIDLVPPDSSVQSPELIGVTLPSTLNFDSSGSLNVTGSECAGGTGPRSPVDCGKKKSELDLFVSSPNQDLLRLKNAGENPGDPYKNCPNGSDRPRAQIGPDDGSLFSDLLFDQDIEEITVVGKQHRTIDTPLTGSVTGTISYTITLDWTLKLERPPKKSESGDASRGPRRYPARPHQ
jgi:hypothetical protein